MYIHIHTIHIYTIFGGKPRQSKKISGKILFSKNHTSYLSN